MIVGRFPENMTVCRNEIQGLKQGETWEDIQCEKQRKQELEKFRGENLVKFKLKVYFEAIKKRPCKLLK